MNSDGTNEVKLTSLTINGTSCSAPLRYSPDGTKIMYSYHNGTQWDIFIMNVDGSGQTNLTNTPGFNEMVSDWK
jgi:Tol biopolymer transport system component